MALHVLFQALAQEARVAQLVHLVRADHQDGEALFHRGQEGLRAAEEGDAAGGERHFRGGGEQGDPVLGASGPRQRQDGFQPRRRKLEIVNGVGVVPQHQERLLHLRWQRGQAAHGVWRVDAAGGVGVFRYAPDAAHGVVCRGQFFHRVHVRPGIRHRHGDELHAKGVREGEVAVVTRHWADRLGGASFAPGRAAQASVHRGVQHMEHQGEAGVAAGDHFLRGHVEKPRPQGTGLGDAPQDAVVAHVRAVLGAVVAGQIAVQRVGEIQLLRGGLATGEVEREIGAAQSLEPRFQGFVVGLLAGHRWSLFRRPRCHWPRWSLKPQSRKAQGPSSLAARASGSGSAPRRQRRLCRDCRSG